MKNPVFRTIFFVYLGLLAVAAVIVLGLLWKKLVIYQAEEEEKEALEERLRAEEQAPQLFFMNYVSGLDSDLLAQNWLEDNSDSLETFDTAKQYFDELISSDEEGFVYYRADSYSDASPKYIVELGGSVIADIGLVGSGLKWEVGDIEVHASGDNTVSFEIPDGFTMSCNGKELGDEYILQSDIVRFPYDREREVFNYDEVLTNEIKWNVYGAGGFLIPPEVLIKDRNGEVLVDAVYDGSEEGPFDFLVYSPDDLEKGLQESAVGFLEAYLTYYTYGKNGIDDHIAAAQAFCFSGSPADKSLINAYEDSVSWAYGHTNLRNEILELGRPVMWADNCCSVDIKYHAYAKRGGEELDYSRRDEMIRIVLIDKGSGYKVYAFDVSPAGSYL